MKQDLAQDMNGVTTTAEKLAEGSALYATILNLVYGTVLNLNTDRQAAVTARQNHENAKELLRSLRVDMETTRLQARGFSMLSRDNLKPILGTEYSESWGVVGYHGSLTTPGTVDELVLQMEAYVDYFTAHPTQEVAAKQVTATDAQAMRDTLTTGRQSINDQEAKIDQLMAIRDAKFNALRKRIRLTISELESALDPMDPRWKSFGLNMPGAAESPDVPTNISAILIGPTAAAIKWDAAPRAEYYRVWMKIHGAETEYATVGSPADLDFTLENLPANSTIEIAISAVNNGGESALSPAITVTTHA